MAILIDYSHLAISSILMFQKDLEKTNYDEKVVLSVARHSILSTIKSHATNFRKYGPEIVLAVDGNNYWRKGVFPYYKASRKKRREASNIDWKAVFSARDQVQNDLQEYFPYKVINIENAEGDDIIACLASWIYANKIIDNGFFEESEPVMIISNDKDFIQLQIYPNVSQWNNITKKQITLTSLNTINSHIAKGDFDDGIPNVLSDDDTLVTEGKRQHKLMAKRLSEFTEHGKSACINDYERTNWDRNNMLINFSQIPQELEQRIISRYLELNPKRDLSAIMNYLIQNRLSQLLSSIEDF